MDATIVPFRIERDMYDKISDDLMLLGQNCILRFNTILSSYDKDGNKDYYHKEFTFINNKSNLRSVTVRRNFQYYISIENIKYDNTIGGKEFIIVGVNDYLRLKFALEQVIKWFVGSEYNNIYANKNEGLVMISRPDNVVIDKLPMNKVLAFEPITITYQDGVTVPGLRIYLSSDINYTDITVGTVMGFYYQILNLNMHLYAQNMINYLESPALGTNMMDMNNMPANNANNNYTKGTGIVGREIGGSINNG